MPFRTWIPRVILVLLGATAAAVAARPATIEVELEKGLLTLEARDAPLLGVLMAIGGRTGFETILLGQIDARVNISLSKIPLERALEQILKDSSRVIVYTPSNNDAAEREIARIWLLGSGKSVLANPTGGSQGAVADGLQHIDARRRSEAVLRLGSALATETKLDALIQALQNDEIALVRSRAAIALGALEDERAVPALEVALVDENSSVRIQAIHALSKIGGERAILALGDLLLHNPDELQRAIAAQGLAAQATALARLFIDAVASQPDGQTRAASKSQSASSKSSFSESRL